MAFKSLKNGEVFNSFIDARNKVFADFDRFRKGDTAPFIDADGDRWDFESDGEWTFTYH